MATEIAINNQFDINTKPVREKNLNPSSSFFTSSLNFGFDKNTIKYTAADIIIYIIK